MQSSARTVGMGVVAGLSADGSGGGGVDSDPSYEDITYGIHLQEGNNNVYVYEGGQCIGPLSTYSAGDEFRVSVVAGGGSAPSAPIGPGAIAVTVVKYYQRSATGGVGQGWNLLRTGGVVSTEQYPLRIDASLGRGVIVEKSGTLQPSEVYRATYRGATW